MMSLLPLSVLTSYFLVIIALFITIFRDLAILAKNKNSKGWRTYLFLSLSVTSFAHTWYYMFAFLRWSFVNHQGSLPNSGEVSIDTLSSWLRETALFEQAWAAVCRGSVNWWWSEQLCLFTVGAWTVFLASEGRRHNITHIWVYMVLGQLVAISVASNLFYAALILSPPTRKSSEKSSFALWFCVFASLLAVATSPFTNDQTFLPNLLAMHALIIFPLLSPTKPTQGYQISTKALYVFIFLATLVIRLRTLLSAWKSIAEESQTPIGIFDEARRVLYSHPAQSSIGWDVVWTSISFTVWAVTTPYRPRAPTLAHSKITQVVYLLWASPLVSTGVTAPYILFRSENAATEKEV